MGHSTYTYIGPYLRLTGPLTVTEKGVRRICARCDTSRLGKYCETCGGTVSEIPDTVTKNIESAQHILWHILSETKNYDLEDTLFSPEHHSEQLLLPNYHSNYALKIGERCDIITFTEILTVKDLALSEFETKTAKILPLMEQFWIDYVIDYGMIWYQY
jgi:hypothetical protein